MPEITVAMTSYNLARYLKPCFDDLSAQSFQDFEILVYDDCSTDETREHLMRYQAQFGPKMRMVWGEAPLRMASKARNALLDMGISGKYVVFLDGDDRIEPDFLERLYTEAESRQADVAVCAYDRFEDESGHVLCQEMRGWPKELLLGGEGAPSPALINTALWNKLIRTERISGLRMPEVSVGEDAAFVLSLYMRCKKIACIDEILVHYRVRDASVISNTSEEAIYALADALEQRWRAADKPMKDHIALAVFIHIGLSLAMRAYDSPRFSGKRVLAWIRGWFDDTFHWFRGNPCFRMSFLLKHGVKGLGLWTAFVCYRCHCFRLFLWAIDTAKRIFHMDYRF